MSLKSIFQEGMKERKRIKSLGKITNELKGKEKTHSERLTLLGQKAWESKTDISVFADLRTDLNDVQKTLAELKTQAEQLQKQKQDSEAKKKQENDRIGVGIKGVEEKKREVDKRLNEQKNALQAGQKGTQRATSRLAAIVGERSQLQNKNTNPEATETEKLEIAKGLSLLSGEEEGLKALISGQLEAGKPIAARLAALQEETGQLQKQLEGLRSEQTKMASEMDKTISALNNDLVKNSEKIKEAERKQKLDFQRLGEKLADAKSAEPGIATEIAAVLGARSEMEGVQAMIGGLERQKDDSQVSAYKKMMAIIIGAVILLAAIVIALTLLLSPKKKTTPIEELLAGKGEVAQSLGQIASQIEKNLGQQATREKATAATEAGKVIVDEILAAFDQCVAEAAILAKDKPEAAVLLPQLEKLYAGYGVKMAALNKKFLALRDQDIFAFRQANGYMSNNRPQHVFAKDNALSPAIAYYNFEKGEQAVVDMLANKIVRLIDDAMKQ